MNAPDIVVINPNPAYDVHYLVDGFEPYGESYGSLICRNIGGKGVNVALALRAFGKTPTCIVAAGKENSAEFIERLAESGVKAMFIECDGAVRENITLHKSGFRDTRVSVDSFRSDDGLFERIVEKVNRIGADKISLLLFCGRLPAGVTAKGASEFLSSYSRRGIKTAVDSNSLELENLLKIRPWLIKPNKDELENLTKRKIDSVSDALKAAREVCARGVENILVSLGDKGAMLVTKEYALFCEAPEIIPKSTVGAGDSLLAGFVYAYSEGMDFAECLKYACAFGSASCLEEGTNPPKRENVGKILSSLKAIYI